MIKEKFNAIINATFYCPHSAVQPAVTFTSALWSTTRSRMI